MSENKLETAINVLFHNETSDTMCAEKAISIVQTKLDDIRRELNETLLDDKNDLEQDKKEWHDTKTKVLHAINRNSVRINIGGTIFQTTLETLRKYKDSTMASMYDEHVDLEEEPFIDRDPQNFSAVLSFLRSNYAPVAPSQLGPLVWEEFRFWQLQEEYKDVWNAQQPKQIRRSGVELRSQF